MQQIAKELTVNLGDRSYPIRIGRAFGNEIAEYASSLDRNGRHGAVLVDENLLKSQPSFCQKLIAQFPHLVIPSGETSKSSEQLIRAWDFLADAKIDRSGFIFVLGGGVVGDLAGFVAATYLRGITFYQIPTTLLAMVDSSVGGKTGINLNAGKNLVGSFHQPSSVWIDLDLLPSLPLREFSAGMAEVIKYGMLGDIELFDQLLSLPKPLSASSPELPELIRRCCSIKARIVQGDERETPGLKGGRALLNLGHTFAHAIEKVTGYGTFLHGEAVSIGLVCALRLSRILGNCQDFPEEKLLGLLNDYNLPTKFNAAMKEADLINAMHADKKVDRGVLRFVVMEKVGDAYCTDVVNPEHIKNVWASVGAV